MAVLTNPETYKAKLLEDLKVTPFYENFAFLKLENIKNINVFEENKYLNQDHLADYRLKKLNKILILGGGGVASWFLPQLIKIIYNYKIKNNYSKEIEIVIIDGDTVETKNLLRQNFIPEDIGKNKAQVLAERYDNIYEGITIKFIPKYFYSKSFYYHFKLDIPEEFKNDKFIDNLNFIDQEFTYAFNFVDNELSKHMLDFTLNRTPKINYFCTGCDLYNGNIFYSNLAYDNYTSYFKDVTFLEEDTTIDTHDCATAAEVATAEQTFDTNNMAANILAVLVNNFISNPSNFTTKRVNFVSTAFPKTEVVDEEESIKIYRFYQKFKNDISDVENYLISRNFEFKRSKLGNDLKQKLNSYSNYIDADKYIEYLRRIYS